MTEVVCGVIFRGNQVFIARRKRGKSQGGKWEFPGGKVELNESYQSALARELEEEFSMKVIIQNQTGENIHNYVDKKIKLIGFKCEFISSEFLLTDHDAYKWVEPEKLLSFDFAEADIPLVKNLIN